MTLDDAINYYDGIAKEYRANADIERNDYMDLRDGAFEVEQLASWLNELKLLRERIEKQPEQHWISCSERLPEEAGDYLCTCTDARRLLVTLIKWQPKMKSWNLSGARAYWKIIAWMPKPSPYPSESEG